MKELISDVLLRDKKGAILNYGVPKCGKTYALWTLLAMGLEPIWFFDFDEGAESLITVAKKKGLLKAPDSIVYYTYLPSQGQKIGLSQYQDHTVGRQIIDKFFVDHNMIYQMLEADGKTWKNPDTYPGALKGMRPPRVLVYDSTTALQDYLLDFILGINGVEFGQKNVDGRSIYFTQQKKMVEIIRSARALPVLSVFNAHQLTKQDETTSVPSTAPAFTGIQRDVIGREFSAVLYSYEDRTKQGADKYRWRIAHDQMIQGTGVRFRDDLPDTIPQDYRLLLQA